MKLVEISAPAFDLAKTLDSGQVFHWEKIGHGFVGTISDLPIYVEQRGDVLKVRIGKGELDCLKQSSSGGAREKRRMVGRTVAHYFALDHPLAEICASFPNDPIMIAARNFCRGLRIIVSSMHFPLRRASPRARKWSCANARSVIAQRTSSQRHDSSVPAQLTSKRLQSYLMSIFGRTFAGCRAWAQRSLIV